MLFTRHATAWVMRQTLFPEACASVTHAECRCGPDMTTPRVCELQDEGVLRWCAPLHYFVHTRRLDDISCRQVYSTAARLRHPQVSNYASRSRCTSCPFRRGASAHSRQLHPIDMSEARAPSSCLAFFAAAGPNPFAFGSLRFGRPCMFRSC